MTQLPQEVLDKMASCPHNEQTPMPDSLATICNECGKVFVDGEPWDYKSGHIFEWADDLLRAKQQQQLIEILEQGKPTFPWSQVIPSLIGAIIVITLMAWVLWMF